MASLTSQSGQFYFPDEIFPEVKAPFRSLPIAPHLKAQKITDDYEQTIRSAISSVGGTSAQGTVSTSALDQTHRLFRWARECLDFAESQPGVPAPIVGSAVDIVKMVASLEGSKFGGAAQYMCGLWHLFGLFGNPKSTSKARELFLSAAKAGYSRALYRLGSDFESRGDTASAITYFDHGVKRGDAACCYRIGMAYLRGHLGKEKDIDTGMRLLEKASLIADPDCPQAAYMFGLIQLGELTNVVTLESGKAQTSSGIMALERSAWLGFGPALIRIGQSWQGGEKGYDSSVALRYFHWAARQAQYARFLSGGPVDSSNPYTGVAEAEISKWMLCGSEGVFEPNEEWAFKFATMAADCSNPIAEFAIGYFYEVGIYVESNIDTALEWYRVAAGHDCKDAKERLKELEPAQSEAAASEQGGAQIGRRLTRKDHERTLSIRGRGSIRSSRRQLRNKDSILELDESKDMDQQDQSVPQNVSAKKDDEFDFGVTDLNDAVQELQVASLPENAPVPDSPHYQNQNQNQEEEPQLQPRRMRSPEVLQKPRDRSTSPVKSASPGRRYVSMAAADLSAPPSIPTVSNDTNRRVSVPNSVSSVSPPVSLPPPPTPPPKSASPPISIASSATVASSASAASASSLSSSTPSTASAASAATDSSSTPTGGPVKTVRKRRSAILANKLKLLPNKISSGFSSRSPSPSHSSPEMSPVQTPTTTSPNPSTDDSEPVKKLGIKGDDAPAPVNNNLFENSAKLPPPRRTMSPGSMATASSASSVNSSNVDMSPLSSNTEFSSAPTPQTPPRTPDEKRFPSQVHRSSPLSRSRSAEKLAADKTAAPKTNEATPLTFEEMGIPAAKEDGRDCIIM